ncbi:hypothetical protein [Nocardioides coralli]|uniref:hypothetical protein n=1 Tax=Nocardioides coralli TaxID=2872154 RepID=UPI001CA4459E|nr:hypothetical protein [Nocardioides coralli]QZY29836.1 hypothetical protein K6T13_03875 [Nocardioides coralli]
MTDPLAGPLAGLQALARDRTERDGLVAQLQVARSRRDAAQQRVEEARTRLHAEHADVEALESMSLTRVLAGLRGSRDADLDRERAEEQAARYALAEAEARAAVEEREVQTLTSRVNGYGDLEARHAELLVAREQELAADPAAAATAATLAELAERTGVLEAEQTQIAEAHAAGAQAHAALDAALRHLGGAGSWATYDTFFGGGMVADLVKHDKLDRAARLMREADAALARLAHELADVGVGAVGEIGISDLTRALDVWFDNLFSDWAVRDRIARASERVHHLRDAVDRIGHDLASRRAEGSARLVALAAERERLLTEGT